MNIAMLTNNYKPFVAGVPIAVERLAQGLRANGHTVYIFAPDYHMADDEETKERERALASLESPAGFNPGCTFRFPTTNVKMAGVMPLPLPIFSYLDSIFSELDIDLIHVHHPVLTGNAALHLGRKYNIPVVFTYHTRYEQYIHYAQPFRALEKRAAKETAVDAAAAQAVVHFTQMQVVQRYLNYFVEQCDLVLAPTQTMADYLEPFDLQTTMEVVPTGLSAKAFDEKPQAADIRKKYLPKDKRYLFCTVSRMAKEKNIDFMLRALAIAKEQIGNIFRVLMIGDGPERKALEALAAKLGLTENVSFIGAVPNDEISAYHQACDLFLFSSQSETQGIVLLEAFAASLPAIAIDATGTGDLIASGENGMLTAADEQDWADKLTAMIKNDMMGEGLSLKEMGAAARQTAEEYEESRIAAKVAGYYRRAIGEKWIVSEKRSTAERTLGKYFRPRLGAGTM
jgi:glycosyltransferase involved in cell wall biosynthesis